MRFLAINHLRLGASPGGIPDHIVSDRAAYSMRSAWFRAVEYAIQHRVHAVFLTGEIISRSNQSLEPFGPLAEGIAQLHQANIPVLAVADGAFTPAAARRFAFDQAVEFIEGQLDWNPPITTSREAGTVDAIHIVPASLAESENMPVSDPITPGDIDQHSAIWLLTNALQPDSMKGENALMIEPGSLAPLSAHETGEHGAWLIDSDSQEATLIPLANLEFVSIAIDVSSANSIDDVEKLIAQALVSSADGCSAPTLIAEATLIGQSRLYPKLADIADELPHTLLLEHEGVSVALSGIEIDATPVIDLELLVGRPDPVGEIARLLNALSTGDGLTDVQTQLITAVDQKLLAVSHARVFGSIIDSPITADANTLLRRQAWSALDMMVRQRGIDS